MESFPASSDEPFEYIKPIIELSDYFVLIIGSRYGAAHPSGKSYTEMELDYAVSLNIPVLVFDVDQVAAKGRVTVDVDNEKAKKLATLREKASTGRMVAYWKAGADLCALVVQAVSFEEKRKPRAGWIRSEDVDIQSLLLENRDLKEKTDILNSMLSNEETMSLDEMKNELSIDMKATALVDEEFHDVTVPLYRVLRLEPVFANLSKSSFEASVQVVVESFLEKMLNITDITAKIDYFTTDPMLLHLRRLKVINFDVGEDMSKLTKGVNWILAHEAANAL
jgi:hypothetical protein